jgi:hypothetical protein
MVKVISLEAEKIKWQIFSDANIWPFVNYAAHGLTWAGRGVYAL